MNMDPYFIVIGVAVHVLGALALIIMGVLMILAQGMSDDTSSRISGWWQILMIFAGLAVLVWLGWLGLHPR